jgi:hypothetical protein
MKKWVLAAAAAIGLAGAAQAGVITLSGVSQNGPGDFTWTYQGTLGPDEGLRSGDKLIIFDFAGYIDGSISAPFANVATSVEFSSPSALVTPGFTDDPTLANLVFTYTGPDFRNTGGPFTPLDFSGLSARSRFNGLAEDAFYGLSTKNNPDGVPGGSNTKVFSLGSVTVPTVPEPATWAMMLGGFGMMGAASRRARKMKTTLA